MSSSQLSYEGGKLYYTPTSCSFSVFATAHQLGLKGLKLEQVDIRAHKTNSGVDFYTINPKGNVPTFVFPDGSILNETAALLQFISDQKPSEGLTGAPGSKERYQIINALNFVASEMHTAVGGLFYANDATRESVVSRLNTKLTYLNKYLEGKSYYANNKFSVVDTYLATVISWLAYFPNVDTSAYTNVHKYATAIYQLPQIKAAKEAAEKNPEAL